MPPPERRERFLAAQREQGAGDRRAASGARCSARPRRSRAQLDARSPAEYGAEEVIVVNITYDHGDRRRSYELIAEAFELSG